MGLAGYDDSRPLERLPSTARCARASAGEALAQHLLALLGSLAALALRAPEEIGELVVAVALRVLGVGLEPQDVRQALLGEPDDVVVLVLRAGDLAGLGLAGRHRENSF